MSQCRPGIVFTTEDSKDVLMWGMPGVGRGASVGSMKSEPEMAGNTLSPMHLNSFSKRNDSFFQRKDVEKQTRVLTRRRSDWDWKRKIFGIGPQTWSTPKSDLIHPESPFAQGVIIMSSLLLVRLVTSASEKSCRILAIRAPHNSSPSVA